MLKDKLKEIIAIVEESNVHEVEVSTWWGRKIRVTKDASNPAMAVSHASGQAGPSVSAAGAAVAEPVKDTSGYHKIHAPIVGTFYRAPSPESAPYINVGDKITVGQVISIIEAMKIMNEIESDVEGTVVEVLVEDTSPVEFNQPLVIVDPG